jgi:hypothetical protein
MSPALRGSNEARVVTQNTGLQEGIRDTPSAIAEAWSPPDLLRSHRPERVEVTVGEGGRGGGELRAAAAPARR